MLLVAFEHWVPFTWCITKIDGATIDDAENLDLVMPMYSLMEYSSNFSETTERLWCYSKDETNNFNNNSNNNNYIANIVNFKSLK